MKRRNFLKGLCAIPAMGFPSLMLADDDTTQLQESGLDRIITIIQEDTKLNKNVTKEDIDEAINSAKMMNEIILEAIINTGVANDKNISIADTRELNNYIFHNYYDEWISLHGIDEDGNKIGFNKVVDSGARTRIYSRNAINKVFNGIYHLGFPNDINKETSINYKLVSMWLNNLLKEDLESGELDNPNIQEIVGETQTGLDRVIDIIYNDTGLQKKVSIGDIRIGANSANEMNKLIIEAIDATNAGSSGEFTISNLKDINSFLVDNYAKRWTLLHGDNKDEKSGYHKIEQSGARTKLFERNAINRIFSSIYHLGFKTTYNNRLADEKGDRNIPFKKVAQWLTNLLSDELENQKEDLKILIPLYSYPDLDKEDSIWQQLIDTKNSYPDIEIVAIVNPDNGHFSEQDSSYSRGIQDLINGGIKVVGYVYTSYAKRDKQDVIDDIEAWREFYKEDGVSGIFFDETSTNSDDLDYYTTLSNEAKNRELDFIILNPGITTDQDYIDFGIANIVVTYENSNRELLENPPTSYNQPTQTTELSLLIYEMEDDNVDDLISFAREHQFEYIYFTEDGFDGNPWDSISEYFEDEVSKALV
ncbi:MAG: hypothetical protein GXO60_01545 [Epsilonproteobacteria bacterium]|nr:hypothetical protein [Campylobacterota bacterium]